MHPIAFHVGTWPIHWYGVMIALAFFLGLWTAGRRAQLQGIPAEKIQDAGIWLVFGTLIGARAMHVITYWREFYAGHPITEIFMLQKGGLVFYGGLIGASLACILYSRWSKIPLWKLADILTPSIALGYVFGRIGCLMNGCCYGAVCDLPWAIRYPNGSHVWEDHYDKHLVGARDVSLPVHPTQIYESLLNLGLYIGLAWLYRHKKFDGQVFAAYLLCYALTRSLVESFRGDYTSPHLHAGLTPAHLISIGIFATGLALIWILRQRTRLAGGETPP